MDKAAPNAGLAGAKLGIEDNNTTGRFLGQGYDLADAPVSAPTDCLAALGVLTGQGIRLVLTDVPAGKLLELAKAGAAAGTTVFNVAAPDTSLRQEDCRWRRRARPDPRPRPARA